MRVQELIDRLTALRNKLGNVPVRLVVSDGNEPVDSVQQGWTQPGKEPAFLTGEPIVMVHGRSAPVGPGNEN